MGYATLRGWMGCAHLMGSEGGRCPFYVVIVIFYG